MSTKKDDIIILGGRDGKKMRPEDRERLIEMARVMFDEMERENKALRMQECRYRQKGSTAQKHYDAQD